jgi:hypothetical protein
MNESFDDWVESTIKEFVHKPEGMMNVGPRLHPLTHYMGREAAKLAWDHQQRKINQLLKYIKNRQEEEE